MKTTIRTPYAVNAVFLLLIALGAVAFFGTYQYSHASSIDCRQAFNYWSFQEIKPSLKAQCGKKFAYYTRWEIKRLNDYQLTLKK